MDVNRLWLGLFASFIEHQNIAANSTVYVAIDRTTWGNINLLMVSFIWRKRGIPLYWQRLDTLGNSNLKAQKQVLGKALRALRDYKVVVLGDREFCAVDLAKWLGEKRPISVYVRRNRPTSSLMEKTGSPLSSLRYPRH